VIFNGFNSREIRLIASHFAGAGRIRAAESAIRMRHFSCFEVTGNTLNHRRMGYLSLDAIPCATILPFVEDEA
jgi:hypothetical protein